MSSSNKGKKILLLLILLMFIIIIFSLYYYFYKLITFYNNNSSNNLIKSIVNTQSASPNINLQIKDLVKNYTKIINKDITNYNIINYTTSTVDECKIKCDNTPGCNVITFDNINQKCTLKAIQFNDSPNVNILKSASNIDTYWKPVIDAKYYSIRINHLTKSGADPSIYYRNGYYYFMITGAKDITLRQVKANDLYESIFNFDEDTNINPDRFKQTLMNSNDIKIKTGSRDVSSIWAPEIHYIEEVRTWYILFSFSTTPSDDRESRIWYLYNDVDDFNIASNKNNWKGPIKLTTDEFWAIDPTITKINGNLYMIHSHKNRHGENQQIAISRITIEPTTKIMTMTNRTLISSPTYPWEFSNNNTNAYGVNEGPVCLKSPTNKYFIIYSGSFSKETNYCLGMLTLIGDNPLNSSHWQKTPTPVFRSSQTTHPNNMYGVGHNNFTTNSKNENYLVYHATSTTEDQWGVRITLAQRFDFDEEGIPNFGGALYKPGTSFFVNAAPK